MLRLVGCVVYDCVLVRARAALHGYLPPPAVLGWDLDHVDAPLVVVRRATRGRMRRPASHGWHASVHVVQRRRIALFGHGCPERRAAADRHGWTSPLWFGASEFVGALDVGTASPPTATKVHVSRATRYFNKDDVACVPPFREPGNHGIIEAVHPLPDGAAEAFAAHAARHKYSSTLWTTRARANRRRWSIRSGAAPVVLTEDCAEPMYNASQFQSASCVAHSIWSGRAGSRITDPGLHGALRRHMTAHGFRTPVYYTRLDLAEAGFAVRLNAVRCCYRSTSEARAVPSLAMHNLSELQDCEAIHAALAQHAAPREPTWLFGGRQ